MDHLSGTQETINATGMAIIIEVMATGTAVMIEEITTIDDTAHLTDAAMMDTGIGIGNAEARLAVEA